MRTLRELFRSLQLFRAAYEADGVDQIIDPDGIAWNIWDLEYLYQQLPSLPERQYQAIELCLIQNMKEADAAVSMGVSVTNPVAMYATSGLTNLIARINAGEFPKFRWDDREQGVA